MFSIRQCAACVNRKKWRRNRKTSEDAWKNDIFPDIVITFAVVHVEWGVRRVAWIMSSRGLMPGLTWGRRRETWSKLSYDIIHSQGSTEEPEKSEERHHPLNIPPYIYISRTPRTRNCYINVRRTHTVTPSRPWRKQPPDCSASLLATLSYEVPLIVSIPS